MKVAWVTDSTACIDEELRLLPNLYVMPMTILLDEEEFLDGVDLCSEELFERLKTLKGPPKSSQPSLGAFLEVYRDLSGKYDHVVSIHVSSHFSGTYSSALQASKMIDLPITVVDSRILSYPLSFLIKRGIKWLEEGFSLEEMLQKVEKLIKANETYVLVGSLEQLHRSGRMNGLQFYLGSLLKIKPILSIEDGILSVKDKVRSNQKALERIIQYLKASMIESNISEVYVLYGLNDAEAKKWQEYLNIVIPGVKCTFHPLGAVIGLHAGENTIGISWYAQ
ncbi:DegV family protein [Falsibacillus albus]|uniref:DegV family protein n=1 Tax=Falsibacillus albus TaxID=2478915 RepID=A0A3L7JZQ9_9BACI|nr:DegV family protein [Falsibacillus albus]RLQ95171.1 DegV family protein [Falsibacillus albus]